MACPLCHLLGSNKLVGAGRALLRFRAQECHGLLAGFSQAGDGSAGIVRMGLGNAACNSRSCIVAYDSFDRGRAGTPSSSSPASNVASRASIILYPATAPPLPPGPSPSYAAPSGTV